MGRFWWVQKETLTRLAQVVWLKTDLGQKQAMYACTHAVLTCMGSTLRGELRLVGFEP